MRFPLAASTRPALRLGINKELYGPREPLPPEHLGDVWNGKGKRQSVKRQFREMGDVDVSYRASKTCLDRGSNPCRGASSQIELTEFESGSISVREFPRTSAPELCSRLVACQRVGGTLLLECRLSMKPYT
jgi:hypothetical protein